MGFTNKAATAEDSRVGFKCHFCFLPTQTTESKKKSPDFCCGHAVMTMPIQREFCAVSLDLF